jgi:hypothetical protein
LAALDAVEGPAVRRRDLVELLAALGERHVQGRRASRHAGEEELESEGGLSRTGRAVEQVETPRRQPATEDGVEAGDTGGVERGRRAIAGWSRHGIGH